VFILGIDTATKVCSVALARDGQVIAENTADAGVTHSRRLLPFMDNLLHQAKIEKKEINLVAVSMGPGSFTGLRIGLATAEAFAYARNLPLHGVDTLAALAYNCKNDGVLISPLIDAQKGNFYQALYRWENGNLVCVSPTAIVNKEQILAKIGTEKAVILGECADFDDLPKNILMADESIRMPRAGGVCALAYRDYNEITDAKFFGLEPYYIRRSEAEELWEQLHH